MLLLVDKSAHADPRLEDFLKASPNNCAVLPEFFGAESFAGDPLKNVTRSIAILSKYPQQVRLLRGQHDAIRLGDCNPNHRLELINWPLTRVFSEFCDDIALANAGDAARLRHVSLLGNQAAKFLAEFSAWAPEFRDYIVAVKNSAKPEFLTALRSDKPFPLEIGFGMYATMLAFARFMGKAQHGKIPPIPETPAEANNYFLFRLATASFLLIFSRIKDDSVEGLRPDRMRNDVMDAVYATWATYFDDLLTNDSRMAYVYGEARFLIEHIFPDCTGEALAAFFREHGTADLFKSKKK